MKKLISIMILGSAALCAQVSTTAYVVPACLSANFMGFPCASTDVAAWVVVNGGQIGDRVLVSVVYSMPDGNSGTMTQAINIHGDNRTAVFFLPAGSVLHSSSASVVSGTIARREMVF